jgi:hypothetical protein
MTKVHIREVLSYLWNKPGEYTLAYWTLAGELRQNVLVRRGGKNPVERKKGEGNAKHNVREFHNVLLHNVEAEHDFEVRISKIVGFQGKQVVHWI